MVATVKVVAMVMAMAKVAVVVMVWVRVMAKAAVVDMARVMVMAKADAVDMGVVMVMAKVAAITIDKNNYYRVGKCGFTPLYIGVGILPTFFYSKYVT